MDNELFELMTKMYAEMQEGFKQVNVELKETNQRLNKMEDRVTIIEDKIAIIEEGQSKIEKELKEFRKETSENFSVLEDKLIEMEGINASNHVIINTKLNRVSNNVDFLSHKEFETEREMFYIKQKLNKQRRYNK